MPWGSAGEIVYWLTLRSRSCQFRWCSWCSESEFEGGFTQNYSNTNGSIRLSRSVGLTEVGLFYRREDWTL